MHMCDIKTKPQVHQKIQFIRDVLDRYVIAPDHTYQNQLELLLYGLINEVHSECTKPECFCHTL